MIIIADSGSTKTDWGIADDNGKLIKKVRTAGLNPFQVTGKDIEEEISNNLIPHLPQEQASIHFYGAGCTPEKQPIVEKALKACLKITDECEVASDMLGAARAICGHKPGIACILGTGSNSCAFDGNNIIKNVPALGFILGDEGSGAVMGKILVGDILKNQLPKHIRDRFFEKYRISQADIIDRVYRQPKPNTFLASFVPFLEENLNEPEIYHLVKTSFNSFLKRNVMQYEGWEELPIGFNGSIASIYIKPLTEALHENGMHLGRIIQAPLDALIKYHAIR